VVCDLKYLGTPCLLIGGYAGSRLHLEGGSPNPATD
jgi:hypothetical protein